MPPSLKVQFLSWPQRLIKRFSLSQWLRVVILLGAAALAILPFVWLTASSLRSEGIYAARGWQLLLPTQPTLEYYRRLFAVSDQLPMLRFFGNTCLICLVGVSLEIILASLAAYPLARLDFKGKNLAMTVLLTTLMLPTQANMIINFTTIRALGLFDTLIAVVLPGCVSVFGIFLMRQAFLAVPRELEDAARIDGCGEWGIFYRVCLPLTRPSQATLGLFAFTAHWNSFMWPLVVLKSSQLYPLSVGLAYLASSFVSDFRLVAAGSVLGTLPMVIIFLCIQKQFIEGITAGAVKQ